MIYLQDREQSYCISVAHHRTGVHQFWLGLRAKASIFALFVVATDPQRVRFLSSAELFQEAEQQRGTTGISARVGGPLLSSTAWEKEERVASSPCRAFAIALGRRTLWQACQTKTVADMMATGEQM